MRLPHCPGVDWDGASEHLGGLFRGYQPGGRLPYWGMSFIWAELAWSLNRDMKTRCVSLSVHIREPEESSVSHW